MRRPENIKYIIVHCAATKPSQDIGVEEIRRWHLERGFKDIGYHYVIRRDGSIESGRPEWNVGAHAKGYNASSIGVCLVGGLDNEGRPEPNYTPQQWSSLARLVRDLHNRCPNADIIGHNNVAAKDCPCFDVRAWWKNIQESKRNREDTKQ